MGFHDLVVLSRLDASEPRLARCGVRFLPGGLEGEGQVDFPSTFDTL